jgi:protein-disulfide isomerase
VVLAAVAVACASDPNARTVPAATGATVTIPPDTKLLPAPTSVEPEDLAGVNISDLNERERHAYWRWVSQLYAPCPDEAVSIAQCVKDQRPCADCVPAARFLAARARAGAGQSEAIAAFRVRFGRDVKKVDLADSPARGPASAPVTMIIWSDFECPACGFAVPYIDDLLEKHPNDVRLIHKLYPLKVHAHSRQAAKAAIAAKRQGKYWEMEKQLFSHQKHLEDADLEEYARNIGLDMNRFSRDFIDPTAEDIIDRDRAEADKQGLTGTPFILINGREFDLAFFKLDRDLEAWIDAEVETHKKAGEQKASDQKEGEKRAAAAVGAALTGDGKGTVGPMSTAVPAASAVPAATAKP